MILKVLCLPALDTGRSPGRFLFRLCVGRVETKLDFKGEVMMLKVTKASG